MSQRVNRWALSVYIWASPDSAFRELSRGMQCFWRSRSLAAVVADNLVDLDDDILGNLGINGLAIDHLCESNTLVIILRDRNLAEHLILVGNDHANNITRYVRFP